MSSSARMLDAPVMRHEIEPSSANSYGSSPPETAPIVSPPWWPELYTNVLSHFHADIPRALLDDEAGRHRAGPGSLRGNIG